jgi:uncharacterized protein YgbK (DUF1537 family)
MTPVSAFGNRSCVVLDDDPTGVQTLAGVRVLLDWDEKRVRAALVDRRSVHLITNSRALPPHRVEPLVSAAARIAREAVSDARVVLRGDSTLRGHMLEEYLGVRSVFPAGRWPVLLLVPALPAAGRITVDGVHLFVRDGVPTALHETEYATDGVFAYASARLLDWAEERSHGLFRASDGGELSLAALREGGHAIVANTLCRLGAHGRPAAFAPDAETEDDLRLVAAGLTVAEAKGCDVIVRCAPAFAGVLAGTTARAPAPLPEAKRVLVVCGSYVPQTTRQLARLRGAFPEAVLEVDVGAFVDGDHEAEARRLSGVTSALLDRIGLAVVATPRHLPGTALSLEVGSRVAAGLAGVVTGVVPHPDLIVAKGGITSAVTLRDGVGAAEAEVVGPVEPGVSCWSAHWPGGEPLDYVVVPGNVGDDELLARLVAGIVGGSSMC